MTPCRGAATSRDGCHRQEAAGCQFIFILSTRRGFLLGSADRTSCPTLPSRPACRPAGCRKLAPSVTSCLSFPPERSPLAGRSLASPSRSPRESWYLWGWPALSSIVTPPVGGVSTICNNEYVHLQVSPAPPPPCSSILRRHRRSQSLPLMILYFCARIDLTSPTDSSIHNPSPKLGFGDGEAADSDVFLGSVPSRVLL